MMSPCWSKHLLEYDMLLKARFVHRVEERAGFVQFGLLNCRMPFHDLSLRVF